jgi:hypothetical protein
LREEEASRQAKRRNNLKRAGPLEASFAIVIILDLVMFITLYGPKNVVKAWISVDDQRPIKVDKARTVVGGSRIYLSVCICITLH